MKRNQWKFLIFSPLILAAEMTASACEAARVFVEDFRARWKDLGK